MEKDNFTTIDQYIDRQSEKVQPKLRKIREIIAESVPQAEESISYRMPLFRHHGMIAYFAAFTNHYSIFVSPEVLDAFKPRLEEFELSKSGIKIPISKNVPEKLLAEIVRYASERNLAKVRMKKEAKKKK